MGERKEPSNHTQTFQITSLIARGRGRAPQGHHPIVFIIIEWRQES